MNGHDGLRLGDFLREPVDDDESDGGGGGGSGEPPNKCSHDPECPRSCFGSFSVMGGTESVVAFSVLPVAPDPEIWM